MIFFLGLIIVIGLFSWVYFIYDGKTSIFTVLALGIASVVAFYMVMEFPGSGSKRARGMFLYGTFILFFIEIISYIFVVFQNFIKKKEKRNNLNKSKNIYNKSVIKNQEQLQKPKSQEEILLDNYGINYIYHMTHIDNLNNILQKGLLSHSNNLMNTDISNQEVNDRRSSKEPIYNRSIHSYVPFYFSPRNAMLYSRKEIQGSLVILAIDRSLIYQYNSLFTDGNAAVNITKFYKDLNKIQTLNWNCIRAKSWTEFQDGKRIKMAETLVFNHVPTRYIQKIYCNNKHIKQNVDSLLANHLEIKAEVNHDLFF